jgi:Co/Zn/Cd efflux system component
VPLAHCIVTSLPEKYSIRERLNLRKVVIIVALLNLAYFGVEFAVALAIGSVSLFADSIDFLEDASVNFLIAIALGWSATSRARIGMALAGILLIPGLARLGMAWQKFMAPMLPAYVPLSLGWSWRISNQLIMRAHAGAFPYAQW